MYYFSGNEDYLIEDKIKEIVEKNKNDYSVHFFNSETKIQDVVNQISSLSLFDPNRIIVFSKLNCLNGKVSFDEAQQIIQSLKFKPNTTIVIFTSESIKENQANEIVKFLWGNATCFKFNELSDKQIKEFVSKKINDLGATISEMDLFYLLSKLPNKLSIIMNEVEKLVLLDLNISRSNIDDLIQKYDLSSTFDFVNAFQDNDVDKLFKTYYEKIEQGESIQSLIGQISSTLEICSRIYSLKKMDYNLKMIEEQLQKHAFVVKKNNELLGTLGYKKVALYLDKLTKLDADIKHGLVDEKIGFEKFLLETI